MPGIINPKGRKHLNETTRDMTRREKKLTKDRERKGPRVKPFAEIADKTNIDAIQKEIRRLYNKEKKKKSTILVLLRDKFDFDTVEAENIFFYTFRRKTSRQRKTK